MFRSWRLLFFPSVMLLVGTPALGEDRATQQKAAEEILERFTTPKDSSWVIVPLEINGKRYRFGLDTGAPYTTYDKPLWPLLGKVVTQQKIGKNESTTLRYHKPPEARLGKLKLPRDEFVLAADMTVFKESSGEEDDGMIGMDFLKKHIFRIDLDRHEVVFLRSVGPNPGKRLTVSVSDNQPFVQVSLPGIEKPEWFLLDTGCARGGESGTLSKKTFDTLRKAKRITGITQSPAAMVTGWSQSRSGWLNSLSFAGDTHANLAFCQCKDLDVNLLGLELLSRYVVTFDFPHHAIYLKKGRQFDRPQPVDQSGLLLLRDKGQWVVHAVRKGSPAAKAGLEQKDIVLKLNKERVDRMTLRTLAERFSREGDRVWVTIQRGEDRFELPVELTTDK